MGAIHRYTNHGYYRLCMIAQSSMDRAIINGSRNHQWIAQSSITSENYRFCDQLIASKQQCKNAILRSMDHCIYVVWIRYLKARSVAKIYSGTLNSISAIGRANILSGHPDRVNISPGYVTLPITKCAAKGQMICMNRPRSGTVPKEG